MFDYETPNAKEPVDYTGLVVALILAPVFLLITLFADEDIALSACIVLAMIMIAVKIRWYLRRNVWFWAVIAVVLALHIPLVLLIRWPHSYGPTLLFTIPLGIADFLIVSGALSLADKFLSKRSSLDDPSE